MGALKSPSKMARGYCPNALITASNGDAPSAGLDRCVFSMCTELPARSTWYTVRLRCARPVEGNSAKRCQWLTGNRHNSALPRCGKKNNFRLGAKCAANRNHRPRCQAWLWLLPRRGPSTSWSATMSQPLIILAMRRRSRLSSVPRARCIL